MGKLAKRRPWIVLAGVFLAFLPGLVAAHSIREVVQSPATFDQQTVSVIGEVGNMVTRYGAAPYTTFEVLDAEGVALPVFTWGTPTFIQGDACHVTGTFVREKTVGTYLLVHGIEAEKIEKVSEVRYTTESQLFRKRRRRTEPTVSQPQGFFLPRY